MSKRILETLEAALGLGPVGSDARLGAVAGRIVKAAEARESATERPFCSGCPMLLSNPDRVAPYEPYLWLFSSAMNEEATHACARARAANAPNTTCQRMHFNVRLIAALEEVAAEDAAEEAEDAAAAGECGGSCPTGTA